MKSDHAFIAERIAAQHCPELLRSGPAPGELLPLLTQLGERLALALAESQQAVSFNQAVK